MQENTNYDVIYNKLAELSNRDCFEEIDTVIFQNQYRNKASLKEIADYFGFELNENFSFLIDGSSRLKLALISMIYMQLSEEEISYPIFLNNNKENIQLFYLENDLFIISGFQLTVELNEELQNSFYDTLRDTQYGYIIDTESIVELLENYDNYNSMEIAISDYVMNSRENRNLLNNFTNNGNLPRFDNVDKSLYYVLEKMTLQQRLDVYTIGELKNAFNKTSK